MAGEQTIKVEGLNTALRALKRINPDLTAEIKDANRDLAEGLVPVAKSKARRRSGNMVESIRAGATQRSGVVRAGKKRVPYAGPQHFGWPARRISPNPFLWDALDSRRSQIEREYVERVTRIVEAVR
jgi:hypothetical protein